jgi:hypothetical protein
MRNSFGSKHVNVRTSNLAAELHIAERQFLLKEKTLNKEISLIYRAKISSFQKRRTEFRAKVNLNYDECIKVT